MNGLIIDILLDLLLILFPLSFLSKKMKLSPKKISDLKPALKELGFTKISSNSFAIQTILIFFGLVIAALVVSNLLSLLQANDLANVTESIQRVAKISPFLLAYIMIVRPITEEIFFRGFLVKKAGILGSTILFALAHALYFSFAEVIGAFILGLILAWSFKKGKTLWPVIVAHISYNIFALSFILGGI